MSYSETYQKNKQTFKKLTGKDADQNLDIYIAYLNGLYLEGVINSVNNLNNALFQKANAIEMQENAIHQTLKEVLKK